MAEANEDTLDRTVSASGIGIAESDENSNIDEHHLKPPHQSSGASTNVNDELKVFYVNGSPDMRYLGRPRASPHYIGYHAEKLYKVKTTLHNAEGISFLPGQRIIAADKHTGHIEIFNSDGKHVKTVAKAGKPCGIATNRSGMFAFTDYKAKEKAIKVYTEDGSIVSEFGMKGNWKPHGIAITNKGLLIVTDISSKAECVTLFTNDGKVMGKFGKHGSDKHELTEPMYVFEDAKDRVLISDKMLCCIKVYSEKGAFLGKFGNRGSGDGHLLNPRGIAEDAYGNIIVCDSGNRRVSAFSHTGHFVKHLLTATDGVHFPVDISVDKQAGIMAISMHKANGDFSKIRVYKIPSIDDALQHEK